MDKLKKIYQCDNIIPLETKGVSLMKKIIKILVISYFAIIIVIALLKPIFDLQSIGEYYGVMTGTIIAILFVWIIIYSMYDSFFNGYCF